MGDSELKIPVLDVIAMFRKFLFDHLTRNKTDKAEIERIRLELGETADDAILQMARDTCRRIDEKIDEELAR